MLFTQYSALLFFNNFVFYTLFCNIQLISLSPTHSLPVVAISLQILFSLFIEKIYPFLLPFLLQTLAMGGRESSEFCTLHYSAYSPIASDRWPSPAHTRVVLTATCYSSRAAVKCLVKDNSFSVIYYSLSHYIQYQLQFNVISDFDTMYDVQLSLDIVTLPQLHLNSVSIHFLVYFSSISSPIPDTVKPTQTCSTSS